ncbi:MAG: glycosyltransferase family 4 protein [Desulfamplus sp.]
MKQIKILHITPHLGGGVGRVLLNYLAKAKYDSSFIHKLACLDYANDNAIDIAQNIGILLNDRLAANIPKLLKMIIQADIVLIHWWNHPLLYNFLVRTEIPPCRLLIWSHISGFYPPYIFTDKILQYPDLFVFTTPVSYETKEVKSLSDEYKKNLRVVWSTGGVKHVKEVKYQPHKGFNIGYIGTVDYCKMHPDFLNMCSMIDIPDVKFIVCGGDKENEIYKEAEQIGISDKFIFTGLIKDINKYLSIFDVFGYPLAPYHYGTCDQVLAESMACGVVPVVLSNRMETYMVKDGITGIVVDTKEDYAKAIKKLYFDNDFRYQLSKNAKEYAHKFFSLEVITREWERVFKDSIKYHKISRKWITSKSNNEISACDVFLESLGDYGDDFKAYCKSVDRAELQKHAEKIRLLGRSHIWHTQTRGTVHHYKYFFPKDNYLQIWSQLMKYK